MVAAKYRTTLDQVGKPAQLQTQAQAGRKLLNFLYLY